MKFQTHVLFERVKAYAGFARGDFGGIIMGVGHLACRGHGDSADEGAFGFRHLGDGERGDPRAFGRPAIRAGALLIQLFILVIQLNILARLAGGWAATFAGLAFVMLVYRRGLKTSVLSDNVLLPAVMLCLVGIVCAGVWDGVPRTVYPSSGEGDILWALWGATVLFSGPVGDAQHWQRAGRRAYMIGSLFFTAYMAMILFVSSFQFNAVMDVCMLLAVICLTGSTMDSAAVALHAIAGKRAGTILAVLVCVLNRNEKNAAR